MLVDVFYIKHTPHLNPNTIIAVYRASFPATFRELSASRGDYRKVVPAVLVGIAVGVGLSTFLSQTSK